MTYSQIIGDVLVLITLAFNIFWQISITKSIAIQDLRIDNLFDIIKIRSRK